MSKEKKEGFIIHDRRGEVEPKPVCRVCGSQDEHTRDYNFPTMQCIKYLREKIAKLESTQQTDEVDIKEIRTGNTKICDICCRLIPDCICNEVGMKY